MTLEKKEKILIEHGYKVDNAPHPFDRFGLQAQVETPDGWSWRGDEKINRENVTEDAKVRLRNEAIENAWRHYVMMYSEHS